jgi:hypothetical protein
MDTGDEGGVSAGVERPGSEPSHLPPSSAMVSPPYVFIAWCLFQHRETLLLLLLLLLLLIISASKDTVRMN